MTPPRANPILAAIAILLALVVLAVLGGSP